MGERMSAGAEEDVTETFSETRPCPKCGGRWIDNAYKRAVAPHTPEHIWRTCTRCGYSWKERPLG